MDGNLEHAERFERLGEANVLPLDLESLRLERVLDVDDGYGAVELLLFASAVYFVLCSAASALVRVLRARVAV